MNSPPSAKCRRSGRRGKIIKEYQFSARFYDPLLSPLIRPIRQRIVTIAKRRKYRKILDVCCGTGEQLKMLESAGFAGLGIDLSEAMLAVAKKGNPSADCQSQDATQIAFDAGSFDLVTTTFALHEKARASAEKIVSEMVRLVRDGGDMIIVDYEIGPETSWGSKAAIFLIERFAGGEHYRNFRDYLRYGGLYALLEGLPLEERRRYYFAKHGIVLVVLRKQNRKIDREEA